MKNGMYVHKDCSFVDVMIEYYSSKLLFTIEIASMHLLFCNKDINHSRHISIQ